MFGLRYTPEEDAFRATLRAWLAEHLPRTAPPDDESERRDFQRAWQRELAGGGWVGIQWPREHGGRGASLKEQIIFTEEMARARAPEILDAVAVNIVGSVLIDAGTPEQQRRYLPRILPADDVWCLGFSEPNAGSDLASLRCRAERDGDHWVVSGQKVWSSKAHFADWLLLLVRTDPVAPRHRGISCLIVDMHAPGRHVAAARPDQRAARVQRGVPRGGTRPGRADRRAGQRRLAAHPRRARPRARHAVGLRLQDPAAERRAGARRPLSHGARRRRRARDGSARAPRRRSRRRGSSRRPSARTRCGSSRSSTRARTRGPTRRSRSCSAARSSSAPASCRCGWKVPTRSSASASRAPSIGASGRSASSTPAR